MKFLFLSLCLIFGNQLFAQSTLDEKITDFARKHNLYGKKLDKLEAIELDSKLSEEERSVKWNKAFAKWDKNEISKSFSAEEELVNYLPDTYYKLHGKISGYTIEFLLHRTYELTSLSKLSEENSKLLRQLLKKQVTQIPEFSFDVSNVSRTAQKWLSYSEEGFSNLNELCSFLWINDSSFVEKDLRSCIREIEKYDENDWNSFSKYLTKLGIYQSVYSRFDGILGPPANFKLYAVTVLGSAFVNVADNIGGLPLSDWNESDYVKYKMFLDDKEISDFLLLNFLTQSYLDAQRVQLNLSKLGQHIIKEFRVSSYDALLRFEHVFSNSKNRNILAEANTSTIQKLLVAAYNDVYSNFELQTRGEKNSFIPINWDELGLGVDQQQTIDALLNDDVEESKNGLKLALSNGLFETIEWDLEFKLACYCALYNKSINQTRDCNNSYYVLNPFKNEEQIIVDFDVLDSITLADLKTECVKSLEAMGYGNTTFRIRYDGDETVTVHPQVYEGSIIARIVKRTVAKYANLGNLIFSIETGDVARDPELYQARYSRDPTPPQPPPIRARSATETGMQAEIVEFPDVNAEFPRGSKAMLYWLKENMIYPEISRELGDQGRVYVTFIVETDGSITGVDVMRGGVTDELNREAKRLVRTMPKWVPGRDNGIPVRSRCRLPITFTL